ncbi:hypothetical protein P0Y31_02955 [Knoellia sp. 3-2P3]|uniref:hypothetical protein n=1 Tax=unclassified Knoellia TaxID=2618719 RepID=UPI0023D9CD33|nr:hypothetical protein [Knoellia sp. 3-2P3]MDF2091289.1 hypothetical protein [Knoellia sp. 3-2P3]
MRGSAGGIRSAVAVAVTGVALTGLAGCGVVERVMATPTITELPSAPDAVTPTAPVDGASGAATPVATVTPDASAGATPSAAPDRSGWPDPSPLESTERLVVVDSLGIGLAAPTLFREIDPEDYLEGSAALDELAGQMGLTPAQLRNGMLNQLDRMVVGAGDDGMPASIVVTRTPLGELPSASLIRRDTADLLGGTVSRVRRIETPAGPAVHAVYRLGSTWANQHGEAFYLETPETVVSINVTSFSASEAKRLGTRVVKTLRPIE